MKRAAIVVSLVAVATAGWLLIPRMPPTNQHGTAFDDSQPAMPAPPPGATSPPPGTEALQPRHPETIITDTDTPDTRTDSEETPGGSFDLATATLEELQAPCDCLAEWFERRTARREAALTSEATDSNWAHDTMQLLSQFIVDHPQSDAIHNPTVDCRTTFCQIVAEGDHDARQSFETIVTDAAAQPWSTLGGHRNIRSTLDYNRLVFRAIIARAGYTRVDDLDRSLEMSGRDADGFECACATPLFRHRLAELEEAALQTEDKDDTWAYDAEQRLQQFFVDVYETMTQFEIAGIDCRTTFCTIDVNCFSEPSADAFRALVHEAVRDGLPGFGHQHSMSMSQTGDRYELQFRVMRERQK